jgi:hypothetical protein
MPNAEQFRTSLRQIFREAPASAQFIDVNAGALHRKVGGYPGANHKMPNCCQVMKSEMKTGDQILPGGPKSGSGASLTIRYRFPRVM